jgi:hypothetical protein
VNTRSVLLPSLLLVSKCSQALILPDTVRFKLLRVQAPEILMQPEKNIKENI